MDKVQTSNKAQQHDTSSQQTSQVESSASEQGGAQALPTSAQRTAINPQRLTPRNVLYLQRTAGNRAVAQLLGQGSARSPRSTESPSSIQPNRTVGPVGDAYERKSDRMAPQDVRALAAPAPVVQREDDDEKSPEAAPPASASVGRIKTLLNNMLKVEAGDNQTGGLDVGKVRGKDYAERKANILSTLKTQLKAEFSEHEVNERVDTSPLLQSKVDVLARGGSKVKKLSEGMEVQVLGKGPANFRRYLNLLQARTGSDYVREENGSTTIKEIEMAPLKGYARMDVKETEKYGGLVSKINDVVRCSLMFHTLDEILAADKALRAIPEDQHVVTQTKDRFGILNKGLFPEDGLSRQVKDDAEAKKTNLNYRDIIYIVEVRGIVNRPINIEVQFHLETMHEAKSDKKLASKMFGKGGAAANLIIPTSSKKKDDRGSQDIVAKYRAEIGLTNFLAFYEQVGFTGHDLYKIIRYFDLKKFSPKTAQSDISMEDRIAAQKASEDAKQMSRDLYGSVWKSHMSQEPTH